MQLPPAFIQLAERVETHLSTLVADSAGDERSLYEAARHSLLGGGKRLRPLLTITTAQALGVDEETAMTPACAIELIHTYSMIHDDLPCMDDDSFRRGIPTLHRVFPEGHAVLAGDFLLTYAFESCITAPGLTTVQRAALVETLAKRSGGGGLIGGQIMDLETEGPGATLERLETIHIMKTGKLISAAMEFGGIVADADAATMQTLKSVGTKVGLAFQITDDVLDVTASQVKHGNAVGSDVLNNKSTYVTLLGLGDARKRAATLITEAVADLQSLHGDTADLEQLILIMVDREH